MTTTFKSTTKLNFRSTPEVKKNNVIAVLPAAQDVELLNELPGSPWVRVKVNVAGQHLTGYVHSGYLKLANVFEVPVAEDHLREFHLAASDVLRQSKQRRAYRLADSQMPTRDPAASPSQRIGAIRQILDYLNVEASPRYTPDIQTYCNIYAYDFCTLAQAYLPHVWWTPAALLKLGQGQALSPIYGSTINELNANATLDWLKDFGPEFGWKRVFSPAEVQAAANEGKMGVISAATVNHSPGHISVVVPEELSPIPGHLPLQSQAGRHNKKLFRQNWWQQPKYREFGYFVHD